MYQEKLVLAVKHNGRVLREHGDTVLIPFGSEYSLLFKNLNSVRATVRVEIDGQDATMGTSLIVPANGTVDLERFLREGDGGVGNRFKFIERTQKIEDGPRGIKAEDGLIRVEFEFERLPAKIENHTVRHYTHVYDTHPYPSYPNVWYSTGSPLRGVVGTNIMTISGNAADIKFASATASNATTSDCYELKAEATSAATPTAGITVPGSVSEQKFQVGAWFPTDGQKHVMVLKLMGQVGEQAVQKPITVKTKLKCITCGTVNKSGTKFCKECGTGLILPS